MSDQVQGMGVSAPSAADAQQNERKKWADEQTRIDHLPIDQRHAAQAKLHDDMAAAKKDQKPLTLGDMSPDEYVARVKAEREADLAAREKANQERHKAEQEALAERHKGEDEDLAQEREELDPQMKSLRAHVEMWKRQKAEVTNDPARRDSLMRRFDQERAGVANETGFEWREPEVGDRTIAGFERPLPGHPFVRSTRMGSMSRLHPEI